MAESQEQSPYPDYDNLTIQEAMGSMLELGDYLDKIKDRKTQAQKRYDYLRLTYLPNLCEEEDVEGITIENVGRLILSGDMYVSIKAGQKDAAYEWIENNGFEDIITETINSSTLKALIKKINKAGEIEIPADLFNVNPFTRASIKKA